MRNDVIIGTGHTDFVSESPKTGMEMLAEASMEAIIKSNLTPGDVQAIFCGNVLGDFSEGQGMIQSYLANDIGCGHARPPGLKGPAPRPPWPSGKRT